jgi:lipopolysaccharide/colanic/teichoic acid biosynthesis glycosyltransferase
VKRVRTEQILAPISCMEAKLLATPFNLHFSATEHPSAPPEAVPVRRRRERSPAARVPVRTRRFQWYLRCKGVLDFLAAVVLAIPVGPVVALIALVVKLTSRGPAFYTQTRLGKDGRPFTIYKVRTMIDKCESLTGPRWSMPGDPRITRVGWILRSTHLDELPQLLNVLRGEMSLIGPRPERPEFVPELERELPTYRQRLLVCPGVTGLAQVQQPADTDLDSVRRKLAYDLYYIEKLSPWLDARLLFATAFYAVGVSFGTVGRVAGLPAADKVERAMQPFIGDPAAARRRRGA